MVDAREDEIRLFLQNTAESQQNAVGRSAIHMINMVRRFLDAQGSVECQGVAGRALLAVGGNDCDIAEA